MAERRMFAKTIIDSDAFLDMPASAQLLYFHLSMRADDEGFLNNPKKIQRMIGASEDDLKLLVLKKFILHFDSGVVVIKHWLINNYIQNDRRKPTIFQKEKAMLGIKKNKAYTFNFDDPDTKRLQETSETDTKRIQDVNSSDTKCIQHASSMYPTCIQDVSKVDTDKKTDQVSQNSENRIDTEVEPVYPECVQNGYSLDTQDRIDKDRIDNINNINIYLSIDRYDLIKTSWNTLAEFGVNKLRVINPESVRAKRIDVILRSYGNDAFDDAINQIRQSDYLLGRLGNDRPITFDWLIEPQNFYKVLEGQYKTYPKTKGKVCNFAEPVKNGWGIPPGEKITPEIEAKLLDN